MSGGDRGKKKTKDIFKICCKLLTQARMMRAAVYLEAIFTFHTNICRVYLQY